MACLPKHDDVVFSNVIKHPPGLGGDCYCSRKSSTERFYGIPPSSGPGAQRLKALKRTLPRRLGKCGQNRYPKLLAQPCKYRPVITQDHFKFTSISHSCKMRWLNIICIMLSPATAFDTCIIFSRMLQSCGWKHR
jgi:hypothetical protein